MNTSYDLVPSVQTVMNVFPEKKKDNFDRIMEIWAYCDKSFLISVQATGAIMPAGRHRRSTYGVRESLQGNY